MAVNVKVRTPDELGKLEFNYFEAFKIKLDETKGDDIGKKINSLCNKMANDSDPVKVRLGKELRNDAIEIMQYDAVYDPSSGTYRRNAGGRKKEADACKRMHTEKVSAFIQSLGNRGVIYISEIAQVVEKNGIDMKDVDKELQALKKSGLSIIDDTKNVFDFNAYLETEKFLKSYENGTYKNLFTLIGIPETASAAEAQSAEAKSETDNAAKTQKKNNDGVALKNIYGQAKKIFNGNDAALKAYKKYVHFRDDVFVPLKSLKDNGFTTIGRDEYLAYIGKLCSGLGESQTEAAQDLAYILQYLHIRLSGDAVLDKNIKIELCPYPECGKAYIADAATTVCPHCGKPLEVVCWNCKSKIRISSGMMVCPRCSATDKAQAEFNRQVSAFDLLIGGGRATAVQMRASLNKLMTVVPGYTKAPDSEVAKKIAFYTQTIESREKSEQGLLAQFAKGIAEIDKQIALKNYYKAQALLAELKKAIPGFNAAEMENYAKRISAEIARSDSLLQQAKRYLAGGNQSMAIANAAKAIEICADNAEAKQVMRKAPPKAPASVRGKIISDKIIGVEWDTPEVQQLTTYNIIRKVGAKPENVNDGVVIAKGLTGNFYEDKSIITGTPYFYGVFAERAEVYSAVTTHPKSFAVFPDVYDVVQEMVEDKIKVKWTCPDNVSGITVRKAKGVASLTATSGSVIKADGNNGFTDGDCDKSGCSYLIICNYEVAGAKVSSKGVQVYYKPYLIPKGVTGVNVQRGAAGRFTISGSNLTADTKLYLFSSKPNLADNVAEKKERLNALIASATRVNITPSGGAMGFMLANGSSGWLIAVNSNDQLYVSSAPVYVTTVSGLSGITYKAEGGMLTVNFVKVPAVKSIVAKVSKSAFPASIDDDGDAYEFSGSHIVNGKTITFGLPADSMCYVTLFAYAGEGAERALCAPVSLAEAIDNRRKQTVKYAIDYAASPAKPFTVTVKFEADNAVDLSELVFVAGNPWPMNKNAGTEIYRCPSPELKKGMFTHNKFVAKITFKASPMNKFNKIAMFIADDSVKTIVLKQVNTL